MTVTPAHAPLPLSQEHRAGEALAVVIPVLIFSGLSLWCAVRSEGFITADACTHYMDSLYAFREPARLVDVWPRPFPTALFAIPAILAGRIGVRVASLLIALGCAVVSRQMAAAEGLHRPTLALLFTLGEPLLFLHSFGEMTELPFALLLGLAYLCLQRRQWMGASVFVSLTPLARPEGLGFVVLAAALLLLNRKWLCLMLLALPLVCWDIAGWYVYGRTGPWWGWLQASWPWSTQSLYGRGSLFAFVAALPVVVSPLVLPATLTGIGLGLRRLRAATPGPAMTTLIPVLVLAAHSLLYKLGKMGSYGEARYLLVVAPFWGVLAARGWEAIFDRFRWKHPVRWAGLAVLAPAVANVVHPVVPIPLSADWQAARVVAAWYRDAGVSRAYPHILCSHPGVFYFAGFSGDDPSHTEVWNRQTLGHPKPGILLIWDPTFSERNASADRAISLEEARRAGWIEQVENAGLPACPLPPASGWHIFRSPPNEWRPSPK